MVLGNDLGGGNIQPEWARSACVSGSSVTMPGEVADDADSSEGADRTSDDVARKDDEGESAKRS